MDKRPYFLSRANEAAHPLFRETVYPKEDLSALRMKEGDRLDLDFGDHFVGFVTLELGYEGDHPDAPLWLGLRFAERARELEERVVRKGEDPDQAKDAVRWMEDLHLINDRNTAEQVVHSCISKGYGLQRAKQALYEKRIPKEYWDEALRDYPDQMEKIVSFLRSRLDEDSDDKDVKKAVDALLRRGHRYAKIREGLNIISLDSDEFMED